MKNSEDFSNIHGYVFVGLKIAGKLLVQKGSEFVTDVFTKYNNYIDKGLLLLKHTSQPSWFPGMCQYSSRPRLFPPGDVM